MSKLKSNLILLCFLLVCQTAFSQNASKSGGEVFAEIPTLHCLGFRWPILGDLNKNAVIKVSYKESKSPTWKEGFPLLRTIPNPHKDNRSNVHTVKGGWMFAGSIFGLTPNTEYDVKLILTDPDGGNEIKQLKLKTWEEPVAPKGLKVVYVSPGEKGGDGSMANPYLGTSEIGKAVTEGTMVMFKPGVYKPFSIANSGTLEKPIIYMVNGKGEVVFDGGGNEEKKGSIIHFEGKKHLWFENLTFKGMSYALNGNASSHIVVRGCTFKNVQKGFNAQNGGYQTSQRFFVVDNTFIGSTVWPRTKGIESLCLTYLSGSGHIIAYNKITNTGDAVHGTGHGSWSACDIYNNDMNICTDDGIETDHCEFNIRVWNNRMVNVAHGITSQPSRGGPVYIFRNVIYNATYSPFKLHNHTTGVYLFHNTCFKKTNGFNIHPADETVTNVISRNNLFMCASGMGLDVGTSNVKLQDFDNDGFGGFNKFARWNGSKVFSSIKDALASKEIYFKTGAIEVASANCFMTNLQAPKDENKIYSSQEIDCRLAPNSGAIDKGQVLPNFNDNFTGKAPDLGAIELGSPLPAYGPRPKTSTLK